MTVLKPEYCPTQNGTFLAYRPEYRLRDSYKKQEWKPVPITKGRGGTPFPEQFGGIMSTIHLFGYAQAKTLMWSWSALAEERGESVDVRVVEYKVAYGIKAKRVEITE